MEYNDINIGAATILATDNGWALPGGRITPSKSTAWKTCRRMANIFARQAAKKVAL